MSERAKQVRYEKVKAASIQKKERGDCTVKATAMAARMPYNEAHALLEALGRKKRSGFPFGLVAIQLRAIGFRVTETKPEQKNGSKFTAKTIGAHCKSGYYVAKSRGHVFPVINGQVYDWTFGRKHRVIRLWKFEKIQKKGE